LISWSLLDTACRNRATCQRNGSTTNAPTSAVTSTPAAKAHITTSDSGSTVVAQQIFDGDRIGVERGKFHSKQQYDQQNRGDQNEFDPKHRFPLPERLEINEPERRSAQEWVACPTHIHYLIKNPLYTVGF
jgi:hypothetical protein